MEQLLDEKISILKEFISGVRGKGHPESFLIAILHKAQNLYGYLSKDVMDVISKEMSIPTAHVWGVATFYHYFKLKPSGKHTIALCLGTACYVKGAADILSAIKDELKVDFGQTTLDGLFTLQETRCLGACGLAPVAMIDDKIYGELTPKKVVDILRAIKKKDQKT